MWLLCALGQRDTWAGRYAESAPPTLVIAGTLDASAPIAGARRVASALRATMLEVPDAVHGLVVPLLTTGARRPHPCMAAAVSEHARGRVVVDECVGDVASLDFSGTRPDDRERWGTSAWP